ncbi:hypothetical protein E2C01_075774 [Portunus trituberculatus]|uniref:Uncharacterized protein n=1 Tax=Portunus trituberculatus TaxID=210409 RepID=A0A5B7IK17_PORTR|nr:hypothetical protein [Portunus trituberculatus]
MRPTCAARARNTPRGRNSHHITIAIKGCLRSMTDCCTVTLPNDGGGGSKGVRQQQQRVEAVFRRTPAPPPSLRGTAPRPSPAVAPPQRPSSHPSGNTPGGSTQLQAIKCTHSDLTRQPRPLQELRRGSLPPSLSLPSSPKRT